MTDIEDREVTQRIGTHVCSFKKLGVCSLALNDALNIEHCQYRPKNKLEAKNE